jgi:hypothetical protein
MNFKLNERQTKLASQFIQENRVQPGEAGAIGGQFTFTFTNTSIGQICTIIDCVSKKELDLTDYDLF